MCEPIYVIQNITLWSCPINIPCTINPSQKINFTIQNVSRIKTSLNSSTLVFNYTLNQNKTLALYQNKTLALYQNKTLALNTSNSTIVYVPTNVYLNESLPEEPSEVPPSEVPPSEVPPDELPPDELPSKTYLRRSINETRKDNISITTNDCICDLHQLAWLHTLWVLPFLSIVVLLVFFNRKKRHKISNIFIPNKNRKLIRSESWPQLQSIVPKPIVPASEPGDISSRGVFLTGIL
jgi:hypothetical protein